jgi:hypothetical protein
MGTTYRPRTAAAHDAAHDDDARRCRPPWRRTRTAAARCLPPTMADRYRRRIRYRGRADTLQPAARATMPPGPLPDPLPRPRDTRGHTRDDLARDTGRRRYRATDTDTDTDRGR